MGNSGRCDPTVFHTHTCMYTCTHMLNTELWVQKCASHLWKLKSGWSLRRRLSTQHSSLGPSPCLSPGSRFSPCSLPRHKQRLCILSLGSGQCRGARPLAPAQPHLLEPCWAQSRWPSGRGAAQFRVVLSWKNRQVCSPASPLCLEAPGPQRCRGPEEHPQT